MCDVQPPTGASWRSRGGQKPTVVRIHRSCVHSQRTRVRVSARFVAVSFNGTLAKRANWTTRDRVDSHGSFEFNDVAPARVHAAEWCQRYWLTRSPSRGGRVLRGFPRRMTGRGARRSRLAGRKREHRRTRVGRISRSVRFDVVRSEAG
jgi:hypothetical protein